MDTRKLITALAFSFFATTSFAQLNNSVEVHTLTSASAAGLFEDGLRTTDPAWDNIKLYRNANGTNVVKWSIGKEQVLEFLLQGSIDGKNFRAIKRIAAGTSTTTNNYEATDESRKGYNYFRIILIDVAGNYSYSKTVSDK